ncbi:MAG: hypothetical protein RMK81_08130 [Geminicoccaceae bacterium]|nr:hypothetical protein [Geminicoccaceae bacterium]MDW8370226.1 hypothetical protein [Geminicoccaceae bacterium]
MRALRALALLLLAALASAPFVAAGIEAVGRARLLAFAGFLPEVPFEPSPREGAVWPLLASGLEGARQHGFATARAWAPLLAPAALACLLAALLPCLREPADGLRWAARGIRLLLAGLALAGLLHGLGALARLADRVVREGIVVPPEDDRALTDTVLAELRWALAREGPDARIRAATEACDRGLAEALAAGARIAGRALEAETEAALEAARSWRGRLACAAADTPCLVSGKGCRTTAGLLASFVVELTVVGDLRDLARELLVESEPDPVIVGLAAAGLALAAGSLIAPEAAVPLATARAAIKVGIRNGLLRPKLVAELRRLSGEAVDGAGFLEALRRLDRRAALAAVRVERLRPLVDAGEDLLAIGRTGGRRAALLAVRNADGIDELPLFRRVAGAMGEDSAGVFALAGRNLSRAFRVYRAGEEVLVALRLELGKLAASLAGLVLALVQAPAERLLRRALRGWS